MRSKLDKIKHSWVCTGGGTFARAHGRNHEKYWFREELQVEKCPTERNLEGRTFQVLWEDEAHYCSLSDICSSKGLIRSVSLSGCFGFPLGRHCDTDAERRLGLGYLGAETRTSGICQWNFQHISKALECDWEERVSYCGSSWKTSSVLLKDEGLRLFTYHYMSSIQSWETMISRSKQLTSYADGQANCLRSSTWSSISLESPIYGLIFSQDGKAMESRRSYGQLWRFFNGI